MPNNSFRFASIIDMLNKQAETHSNDTYLLYPSEEDPQTYAQLNYKQFNDVTSHLADKLSIHVRETPMSTRPVVCLLANNDASYLLTIYALFKLDVIVFPISTRNSEEAILHLLEKSHASYLFYSKEYFSMVPRINATFGSALQLQNLEPVNIGSIVKLGESKFKSQFDNNDLDKICIIFHSSGSTSLPKPIRLNTRCVFGWFESFALEMNNCLWTKQDTVLTALPLFHVMGLSISIIMCYVGGSYAFPLRLAFPPSPEALIVSLQYPKITKLFVVSLLLEEIIRWLHQNNSIGFQTMARLQFVAYGGASCSPHVCNELIKHGINVINMYGASEVGYVCISDYETTDEDQYQKLRPLKSREPHIKFVPIAQDYNNYELHFLSTDLFISPDFATNDIISTGDLFLEKPVGSGYFVIQGRKDDVLVHTTGEKTNPLPIELAIQEHSIVKHAVVLGHQRLCCSTLIELNTEEACQYEFRSIEEQVLEAVKTANNKAPTHSRIVSALVKILPLNRHLPVTAKGNLIRKLVDIQYSAMVDQMYEQFLNGPIDDKCIMSPLEKRTWTQDTLCIYLQRIVAQILDKPIEMFADYSKSLFSLSLDSITLIELRNILCRDFGPIEPKFIYEYSTIDALAGYLLHMRRKEYVQASSDSLHYRETENIIDKYIDLMKGQVNKKANPVIKHDDNTQILPEKKRVFAVTGVNGSLGSQILLQLIRRSDIDRIYCFVRGENPTERLCQAFEKRAQDSRTLMENNRTVILTMNLNDDRLGQTQEIYDQLRSEVTDIIHSGWKMDFNMNIKDFDQDCLQGLYRLLEFAANAKEEKLIRFHFISSISTAASNLFEEIKEEPLPRHLELALAQGYGQSKYAGEHMCWAAMDLWNVPVDIYRFGQISGDTETGVWNTAEMIPLIICASGGELGVLPDECQDVNWIPVNYAAACMTDIAMNTNSKTRSAFERVHHILNPHVISWSKLLEILKAVGLQFNVLSIQEWLHVLLTNPNNPAYTLASFFEKAFAEGRTLSFPKYSLIKTNRRTTWFQCCPPVDENLIQQYLNYWWKIGFLKQGYILRV